MGAWHQASLRAPMIVNALHYGCEYFFPQHLSYLVSTIPVANFLTAMLEFITVNAL